MFMKKRSAKRNTRKWLKHEVPAHSPKFITKMSDEDIAHVNRTILPKVNSDYANCVMEYHVAYPGYPGAKGFYGKFLRKGNVLYYGVGAGRLFGPPAEKNSALIGIERSKEMLSGLYMTYKDIRLNQVIHADVLDIATLENKLEKKSFDTVIAPYTFLQYIPVERMEELMKFTYQWLNPGGTFVADIFSPYLVPVGDKGETATRNMYIGKKGERKRVTVDYYVTYKHEKQKVRELAVVKCGKEFESVLNMDYFYYYPEQLIEPMKKAGFKIQMFSGYKLDPYDSDAPNKNPECQKMEVIVLIGKK